MLGIASDNIIDGIGITVAYLINPIAGITVALSVIVHEIPQGLTTTILLSRSGKGKLTILSAPAAESILYPAGASLAFLVQNGAEYRNFGICYRRFPLHRSERPASGCS